MDGVEVYVDEWWGSIDMRIVEGAAAVSHTKAPVFKVENIAPWIPPSCRSKTVVNSEVQKGTMNRILNVTLKYCACRWTKRCEKSGMPKLRSWLISFVMDRTTLRHCIKALSTENPKGVCNAVEIPIPANTTKVYHYIFASLHHIHVA